MFVIGDTHGLRPVFNIIEDNKFSGENLIHVGDFGLGFQDVGRDIKNLELLDEALMDTNNQLYVIRGNHDNPIFWDKSKGLNLPTFHYLHLIEDYSVIEIEGQKILFIGGATSIDRRPRMRDTPPTWWKDEVFNFDPEKIKGITDIDIVITHTAPSFAYPHGSNNSLVNHYAIGEKMHGYDLHEELETERMLVDDLFYGLHKQNNKIKKWYYGHFHNSKRRNHHGTEFILLGINEVEEVNLKG